MQKKMADWFFMRPGLDTFLLQPDKHARYLFGARDQRQRDHLLESLEEAAYSQDGYKATVYGDYGRGKTHQCHNLVSEIRRRDLPFAPVYVKCGAFKKKEPFSSLFKEMLYRHSTEEIRQVAKEYARRVDEGEAAPLTDIVQSEDIASVMSEGLGAPGATAAKRSLRWLGGEPKVDLAMLEELGGSLKPQLSDSGDFGDVMRGLSHLFIQIRNKVPLYILDEAERFQGVTETDAYVSWLAAVRELTEIHGIAMIFMVGAMTRDFLPNIFAEPEIVRRIGVANYIEFMNPGRDDLRAFLLEQFQTTIRKGPVPEAQKEVVEPDALNEAVPEELFSITEGDPRRLEAYPFEPDAFDEFIEQIATGEMANKPSEAQIRVQKAAQKTMRLGKKTVTSEIVESLSGEAF